MKRILALLSVVSLLASCEKVVTLSYKGNQQKIIIEGNITNEPGPYQVRVTRSIALSDTGHYPTIDNAIITISDNLGNSEALIPQGNGIYRTTTLTGVPGRTYTMAVVADGETYTAKSTMPQPTVLDSIKIEQFMFGGETEWNIIPAFTDPTVKGNHYRFLLLINNKLINQHFVVNDEIINGLVNTNRLEVDDNLVKLKPGDLITIKMQCIDSTVAYHYTTLALIGDTGPGGGTTPNNPPSNFTNMALGIFSAHTIQEKSKVLQ